MAQSLFETQADIPLVTVQIGLGAHVKPII